MYIPYNNNPFNIHDDDCAIRSISKITDKPWEKVYMDLAVLGITKGRMPTTKTICNAYLKEQGFEREIIPNTCPDCYTVNDFCNDNPTGEYILATDDHMIAVIDGNVYDTWDSSGEIPMFYWKRKETEK